MVFVQDSMLVAIEEKFENIVNKKDEIDYDEIVEVVYCDAFKTLRSKVSRCGSVDNVEIKVIPSVGSFKSASEDGWVIEYMGDARDIFHIINYYLALTLRDVMNDLSKKGSVERVRVVLDISHGHNITTATVLEAVKRFAGILGIGYDTDLEIYCSDPFVKGVDSLRINRVYNEKGIVYTPTSIKSKKVDILKISPYITDDQVKKQIGRYVLRGIKEVWGKLNKRNINPLLKGFSEGVILVVHQFKPKHDGKIRCFIDKMFETWKRHITINREGGRIVVERKISFGEGFDKLVLGEMYLRIARTRNVLGEFYDKCHISLKQLKQATERLRKEVVINRLDRELDKIVKIVRMAGESGGDWRSLSSYLNSGEGEDRRRDIGTFKRNFYAHSGLIYDVLLVKYEGSRMEEIYVKYNLCLSSNEILKGDSRGSKRVYDILIDDVLT